jgi:hypothetical protein
MENNFSYNKEKRTAGGKDKVFNIIIVVLSVILAILIVMTVVKFTEESHYVYVTSSNDLIRSIKNGYYSDAVQDMHSNIAIGKTVDSDPGYSVPYALSDYFESASYYYAYTKAAENPANASRSSILKDRAESFKKDMNTAQSKAGELDFIVDEINLMFK